VAVETSESGAVVVVSSGFGRYSYLHNNFLGGLPSCKRLVRQLGRDAENCEGLFVSFLDDFLGKLT
jgi:hypothetical protein